MVELDIKQSQASVVMSIMGVSELTSRLVMLYVGDYVKGMLLCAYVAFSVLLCVLNVAGSFAYSLTHMVLYAIGKCMVRYIHTPTNWHQMNTEWTSYLLLLLFFFRFHSFLDVNAIFCFQIFIGL